MPPPGLLHHYLELARPYLDEYGYAAVFVAVLVEGFGLPAPGQSLIIAGALLAAQGRMQIAVLLPLAWSAAVLGDNIGYALGRFGGRRLILRHSRYIGVRADHLDRVERFFHRYGGGLVASARFFDILRQLNGVVAGLAGMAWWRFLAFNALGALLWVALWGFGMYQLGHHMERVAALFKHFEPYVIGAGLLAALALSGYLLQHRKPGPPRS